MKKAILYILVTSLAFATVTAFAQDIPPYAYRVATPQEILLHDHPYNMLQQEIEAHICDSDWGISPKPFLLSDNHNEKIVIINYLKGVGNIPVFRRGGESFEIKMKTGSPLYKSIEDETKKQTDAYVARSADISSANKKELAVIKAQNEQYFKYVSQSANSIIFGSISLELNQSYSDDGRDYGHIIKPLAAGSVHQGFLYITLPDEQSPDTLYNAVLYIGNWPKLSGTKMLPFHFIKNNSSEPVIENMIIEISSFNYNKMMKMIHSIDWTKLEALIKE